MPEQQPVQQLADPVEALGRLWGELQHPADPAARHPQVTVFRADLEVVLEHFEDRLAPNDAQIRLAIIALNRAAGNEYRLNPQRPEHIAWLRAAVLAVWGGGDRA